MPDGEAARRMLSAEDLVIDARLLELYERMIAEVDLTEVLGQAAQLVSEALGAERATIYLVIDETRELESAAVVGNVARRIRVPIREESLAGHCALHRKAFLIPDAYGDLSAVSPQLRFDSSWDRLNDFRTRDVLCAPACFQGELLGVVQAINRREGVFGEPDLEALRSVTRLVAYSLYHARLYDELASLKILKREKAKFMRILVHELKSPAAGAKMLASATQMVNEGNDSVVEAMDRIQKRMDRLLGIVGDILHHSDINTGDPLGDISVFDMVARTAEICGSYRSEAEAKGLFFRLELPGKELPLRFDERGWQLVVSNLVSNAVKYTQEGGVTVRLERHNGGALLSVADTGMGIPAGDVPAMFGEFFRASNARKSEVDGTGVGLSGVKDLVTRFHGEIEFESEENRGSTFRVRMPLQE